MINKKLFRLLKLTIMRITELQESEKNKKFIEENKIVLDFLENTIDIIRKKFDND